MIAAEAPVEVFDEIDSTLLEARRRAERGELAPVWLVAKRQSAGKGRRGRAWSSLDGNLMATYLGVTRAPPMQIALLGFAVGIAIAEVFDDSIGAGRATLKWPNDVLIDGAKAAGILVDSGSFPGGDAWFALGFGVNLAAAPEAIDQPTASLRSALPPDAVAPAPLEFLARLRPRLDAWLTRLERDGFDSLRRAWLARAHRLGELAQVSTGDAKVEGRIVGLSPRGELELETAAGKRLIAAGEILISNTAA